MVLSTVVKAPNIPGTGRGIPRLSLASWWRRGLLMVTRAFLDFPRLGAACRRRLRADLSRSVCSVAAGGGRKCGGGVRDPARRLIALEVRGRRVRAPALRPLAIAAKQGTSEAGDGVD
eukprot:11190187-Lingulodinium_polyedra.AAC.2